MTTFTYDQAVERFNEDMSKPNSSCSRKRGPSWPISRELAERINDAQRAERLRRDWMVQFRQFMRELV